MNKKLLKELQSLDAKCHLDNIIFITKDESGQLVWLETGNENAGFIHIIQRHKEDFVNIFGTDVDIPSTIYNIITHGKIVSSKSVIRNGFLFSIICF